MIEMVHPCKLISAVYLFIGLLSQSEKICQMSIAYLMFAVNLT